MSARSSEEIEYELTLLEKHGGPLTKRLWLDEEGELRSDSSQCLMARGTASRLVANSLAQFAAVVDGLTDNQAIALGRLRQALPSKVKLRTKRALQEGATNAHARTKETIHYMPGEPALMLLDVDAKSLPETVSKTLAELGGYWNAICEAVGGLNGAARVERASTRAGLFNIDTMEEILGSNGCHIYIPVADGADIERALSVLHDRLFLAGFGWFEVGKKGQLLERSLIDRSVARPERIVFEGAPITEDPVGQQRTVRRPRVFNGIVVDTRVTFAPLTAAETSKLDAAKKRAKQSVLLAARERAGQVEAIEAKRISKLIGVGPDAALRLARRERDGVLLPHVRLQFDDIGDEVTVADVLARPEEFIDETLADPLEGVEYGRDKAIVFRRPGGELIIHSFAHGGAVYQLRYDYRTLRKLLTDVQPDDLVDYFVAACTFADLEDDELTRLVQAVAKRAGVKIGDVQRRLKRASKDRARAAQDAARAETERVQLRHPPRDGELTPVLKAVDEVLSEVGDPEPPMRDVGGALVEIRDQASGGLPDLFPTHEINGKTPRLAAPPEPILHRLDRSSICRSIEKYIEFQDGGGDGGPVRSVRLADQFVAAYETYSESRLPIVRAIIMAPLVGPSGRVLNGEGLDRDLEVFFRIDPNLIKLVPAAGSVTEADALEAYRFLTDSWLVDVATDPVGKAVAIAFALSLIQRSLLPERPAFFFTAGQRGGGKTTLLSMLVQAVLGRRPSVSPWPKAPDERRKTILAKLREGYACIVWDNIETGSEISCPVIEATLTSQTYTDRVLGVSETTEVPATAVQAFTGNNIRPTGDLASRSLVCRLNVDRPDPENREFAHVDPLGWTAEHREEILAALYTLLVFNPYQALAPSQRSQPKTRFKPWWALVGAPVEAAARLAGVEVDFGALFSANETSDEAVGALGRLLGRLRDQFGTRRFTSADIFAMKDGYLDEDDTDDERLDRSYQQIVDELAEATKGEWPRGDVTAQRIGKRLQMIVDSPAVAGDDLLVLRRRVDAHRGNGYRIEVMP